MDSEAVKALIAGGESITLEMKIAPPRPSEMAERICGFANSVFGGIIVVGVADSTLEIVGVNSVSAAVDNFIQAARLCKPVVRFNPPQPQIVDINGRKLVIATIPANEGELYQAGNVFWLRRGTHTSGMDKRELFEFAYARGVLSWETQPVTLATLDDLNMDKIDAFLSRRPDKSRKGGRLSDVRQILLTLKCAAKVDYDDIIRPTNAGMLLFGDAPQNFFTQAETVIVTYQDDVGVRRYSDRKVLGGTLDEQISEAESYLRLIVPVPARTEGFSRIDEPALPLEALREAVVNALVHHNYSMEGTSVRIFIYPERVEIHNPGKLLPGVTLEELKLGRVGSHPRNPVITNVLKDLPGDYMERIGSGITFMIQQTRSYNLPEPEFWEKESGEFVVTFYRSKDRQPATPFDRQIVERPTPPSKKPPEEEVLLKPGEMIVPQSARQELGLRFVARHGQITNKQYRDITGTSESTAMRDLEMLVERGSLRAIGRGRGRHYVL